MSKKARVRKSWRVEMGHRQKRTGRNAYPIGGSIFGKGGQDFGRVALGFYGWADGLDFAGFFVWERAADDAHEFASHELLLLPGAEGFDGFVVRIAQQRKVEMVFGFEAGLSFDGIGAQAEDGHAVLVELALCVAKLGRLNGST